ncbi:hypothetical protein HBB16_02500 [Pseudonocardia sp. MCCB 268]|nr:hypothetical protein [Pseudonocardia cytotoxica]
MSLSRPVRPACRRRREETAPWPLGLYGWNARVSSSFPARPWTPRSPGSVTPTTAPSAPGTGPAPPHWVCAGAALPCTPRRGSDGEIHDLNGKSRAVVAQASRKP